jgi:hypothetical protein
MNIKKSLPREKYTKIHNSIFTNPNLSDGAKILYGYFASLPNGKTIVDDYVIQALNSSRAMITRRKKELKDADLIELVQLAPRVYDLYIGYPGYPASKVRQVWEQDT